MPLVTALHRDGRKFIVDTKDIDNNAQAKIIEMRDRSGRKLGNALALREIVGTYYGAIHSDAWPPENRS